MKHFKASVISAFLSLILAAFGLYAGVSALAWAQRRPAQTNRGPLNESDVVGLLKMHVSPAEVGAQARRRHIDFVVTASALQELRQAGADDALLQTLREIQPQDP